MLAGSGQLADKRRLLELAPADGPGVTTTTWVSGPTALLYAVEGVGSETSVGAQPTLDRATGSVVVVDGRLDARADLGATLGVDVGDLTDAELVLAAYRIWGVAAPEHLVGDFAFAIWDSQACRLVVARDPVGARTLYYSEWGGAVRFASTLEQMLSVRGISTEIEREAVARYLYGDFRPSAGNSYYRHIHCLPGGHTLVADSERRVALRRFWQWPDTPAALRPLTSDDEEQFREVFADAVRDRLRAARDVAVMLSGGLDSGAVASVVGSLHESGGLRPARTYSIVFDTERFRRMDERAYSRSIVERYRFRHRELPADDREPFMFFEKWRPVFNEPNFAPFDGTLYLPLAAARGDGARTMLMGHAGDLVVAAGSRWFTELVSPGSWRELHRQLRGHAHRGGRSEARALATAVLFRLLPATLQRGAESRRGPRHDAWIPRGLRTEFELDARPPAHSGANAWWYEIRDYFALVGQGRGNHLDRMFRLFGLEQRQPFLDTRLMSLMLRMPPQAFYSDGVQKTLLRRSLSDVLPPLVRDRVDKADFGGLLTAGLRGSYRPFVESLLRSSEIVRQGYVLEQPWEGSVRDFLAGESKPYAAYWRSITLEMWLRHRSGTLPPVGWSPPDRAPT